MLGGSVNQINAMPPETNAGLSFDYSVWSAGSVITMCNVPFDNTYRDIIDWDAYGWSPYQYVKSFNEVNKVEISQLTYLAQGKPIRIPTPFSKANRYNYVMVENPGRPIDSLNFEGYTPHAFFYFITSVDYVAPNTTQLTLQLDVWSTYYQRVKFGRAYLERGHMGIAAVDSFKDNGREWLAQPEGLDVGGEHQVIRSYRRMIADVFNGDYDVVVTSTIDLGAEWGNLANPRFKMANGSKAEGLPNSASVWVTSRNDYLEGLSALSNYPWVAQGIGSVTIIPKGLVSKNSSGATRIGNVTWYKVGTGDVYVNRAFPLTNHNFRNEVMGMLPKAYQELRKFMTAPYCILELTTYTGNPVELRPESLMTTGIGLLQYGHVVPPNPQLMFTVKDYNNKWSSKRLVGPQTHEEDEHGEEWDLVTGYTSLPTFSVLNNSALNSLASNTHQIAAQINSAKWQQRKAQRSAVASRDIANAGIAATQAGAENSMWGNSAMADSQSRYNNMRAVVQATQGGMTALGGAIGLNGQAVGMGLGQAATAGISAMIQNSQAQSTANIQNQLASGASQISQTQQRTVRDTNYELAQFSSNGDYEAAIASINAQQQDMQVIPPSVVGQTAGTVAAMVSNGLVIDCRVRMLSDAAIRRVGDYWLRYGYAMNTWVKMPDRLSLMTEFTYWKLAECYLERADIPEGFKGTIRGIFEKGVTLWRSPQRIGTINIRNNRIDKTNQVTLIA